MGKMEVKIPDIGDYKNVPVIEVLVKDGERVEKDAALITLESEKATMEVPSPAAGTVRGVKVKVGDKVSPGDVIMALESGDASAPKPEARKSEPPTAAKPAPAPAKSVPAPARAGEGQGEGRQSKQPSPPAPLPQAGEGRKNVEVTVPDIGDYHDVPVIEVLVKEGDKVDKDAPLVTLESEKATMEVPAPAAGTVRGVKVKVGAKVSRGTLLLTLETTAPAGTATMPATAGKPVPSSAEGPKRPPDLGPKSEQPLATSPIREATYAAESRPSAPAETPWDAQKGQLPHASPAVRKFARELGVDLAQVQGSGPHGRIVAEDVQGFVKSNLAGGARRETGGGGIPAMPAVDFSQWGPVESKPLSRIRKLSAQYLHRSWLNVPHVTQTEEADITDLEAFRKQQSEETGQKLTLLPFIMKAVGAGLKLMPDFNSSLAPDGESLVVKKYCHIGFAADTENGLVVPVVKDVWLKGIVQLANECGELAKKAREGKLKPDEMKGGCFSISSLGGIGGSYFTPIVNAPEVAILGVSRSQVKPVWDGKAFQPRLMLPLSLSYDHRVIDGAYAARFIVALSKTLADLRRVAL